MSDKDRGSSRTKPFRTTVNVNVNVIAGEKCAVHYSVSATQ